MTMCFGRVSRGVVAVLLAASSAQTFAQADSVSNRVEPRLRPPGSAEAPFTQSGWIATPDRGWGRSNPDEVCTNEVYQNRTGTVISITIQSPANEDYARVWVKRRYSDPWISAAYANASATAMAYVPAGGIYCPAGGGAAAQFFVTVMRNDVPPASYLAPVTLVTSDGPSGWRCRVAGEGSVVTGDASTSTPFEGDVEVWRRDYATLDGFAPPPRYFLRGGAVDLGDSPAAVCQCSTAVRIIGISGTIGRCTATARE